MSASVHERVECWRSLSTYVYGLSQKAAFGVGPVGKAATP